MFCIAFSPTYGPRQPGISVSGDVLTADGETYDFSPLPEGATLPAAAVACAWLEPHSWVTREGGTIRLTLILPHGADAPDETRFPEPVTVKDGPVPLPPYQIEQEAEA